MTLGRKHNSEIDLPALVSQLDQLIDQIRHQVDHELARMQQARHLAARESARLEQLLAKTHSAFEPSGEDSQSSLPEAPSESPAPQTPSRSDALEKHQEVYALAEKGLEPLEIAQRIGASWSEFPGDHLEFITRPEVFAAALRPIATQMYSRSVEVHELWKGSPVGPDRAA